MSKVGRGCIADLLDEIYIANQKYSTTMPKSDIRADHAVPETSTRVSLSDLRFTLKNLSDVLISISYIRLFRGLIEPQISDH